MPILGRYTKLWLAVGFALTSLLVVAWWGFTTANEWVLYRRDFVPVFAVVTCALGPVAGLGCVYCLWLLLLDGLSVVRYALPCLVASFAGFTTHCLCFLVYIAPGC